MFGAGFSRPLATAGRFATQQQLIRHFTLRPSAARQLHLLSRPPFGRSSVPNLSRRITTQGSFVQQAPGISWQRLGITALAVGGTVVVTQALLNRETRDGLSSVEQSYLNSTFKYTGGGLAITALAARSIFKSGAVYRIMNANPWVFLGVSLVGSIGSMIGVQMTSAENSLLKHSFWLTFNGFQAATLSPLFFFHPAILGRAALYTCGVVGSLSYVGATAKSDKYLNLGGPLLAGITVVALSSFAPMVLPLGMRGLAVTEAISLYGGLGLFGAFVLYDTQKILHHGRMVEAGTMKPDPMRESLGLQLDMMNIFIRLVQIFAMQQNRRK